MVATSLLYKQRLERRRSTVSELTQQVERARQSLYFSGARVGDDLEHFLAAQGDACRARGRALRSAVDQIVLVGSGGSWATLATAKYLLDGLLTLPVEVYASYDLIWRNPARLDARTLVVLATYSGETEDVLKALEYVRGRGARTLGIVGVPNSTVARSCDDAIVYESGAIFELPVAALLLIGAGMVEGTANSEAAEALGVDLGTLAPLLREALAAEEGRAEARARAFLPAQHLYVLGAGPLSPLAYKVALTVVMENIRIGATYCDASEFRHGPAEAFERSAPHMMFLVGSDASRDVALRTLAFCEAQGARTLVYDAAELAPTHPLLTPLVLNSFTQWFTVYSAILRGITDLDARVFMGRNVLAAEGAKWP
jgi:fructoselysine-6-P-deglycase FrlB-like protein